MSTFRVTELHVNEACCTVDVDGERSLLGVLREDLDLTGTKYGCGEGQCGACVVLVDGQPAPSCITPVGAVVGKQILTVEGLAQNGRLHPLQQAFLDAGALQCGYCTPGMIMAGVHMLAANPAPTADEVVRAMERHICRCGAYARIVRAIQAAAVTLAETRVAGGVS
jgi:aerobic-type carbon monoxide dehydrogenase small subunit (CoxS/CutS family)